jgi:ABC-type transport system involved in multi-copper enzyme maturation permease subunit
MGITLLSLGFFSLAAGRRAGNPSFGLFAAYVFGLCLLAGAFLTADSMTEEKREGTLGLLFLTDLKGYDVVLGKFIALSLNAFYGLLALLPMAALPLLLGGVTGGEFWRMALALVNALFFSLAAGICMSVFMRDSQRAMGNTLGLMFLLAGALPLLAGLGLKLGLSETWLRLAWCSPFYPFSFSSELASATQPGRFWTSLFASNLAGWVFLVAASIGLPRVWQEKVRSPRAEGVVRQAPQIRDSGPRTRSQTELLSKNPVLWLTSNLLGTQWGAWAVVAAWAVTVLVFILFDWEPGAVYAAIPFGLALKALFAIRACRFFMDGRRDGALELLLCTPLTNRELVWGQALAVWRSFAWPLIAFVGLLVAPTGYLVFEALFKSGFEPSLALVPGSLLIYLLQMAAELSAVCWVGMALALTSKRPNWAPALTILFVLILPYALCWLSILADLCFIAFGISRCERDLRRVLTQQYEPVFSNPVPLAGSPQVRMPPVIRR